ncbi:putative transcriptional regulator, TetR [Asanoa ishikariensis]|uniref:TetR/AcrR family transcriptional regulator n=1 Tax=Asanoa ishikariensis TaxID=137265 RepID=UPI001951CC1D|nr:TetR/AcrR family transcriptional regulator [Asanoa ishikariensis]GIF69558.1 putative transcriptional regulator, TetR [Asanoa ishikariensis]
MTAQRRKNTSVGLDESEILQRGLEAFAELGYEATTMRELARRLGVSHNFIHDRYGSKSAFWRAVVDFALAGVQEERDELLARHSDDADRLEWVVRQLYRMAAAASDLNRLIADESTRDSDRLDYLHRLFIKPFWDSIEPTVSALAQVGKAPDVPSHVLYFALIGPALALAQNPIVDRIDPAAAPVAEQDRDRIADALADVVLRGLLPEPPASAL